MKPKMTNQYRGIFTVVIAVIFVIANLGIQGNVFAEGVLIGDNTATPTVTESPTVLPTAAPTDVPTTIPTEIPTLAPTLTATQIQTTPVLPTAITVSTFSLPVLPVSFANDGKTMINGQRPIIFVADPNPENSGIKVADTPAVARTLAGTAASRSTFSITFAAAGESDPWGASCDAFPADAKTAFNAAASIWANAVYSPVPVTIFACWSDIGSSNILGYSGGGNIYRDFTGAPKAGTWYDSSLADALSGSNLKASTDYDDYITFNTQFPWYYGTDGNTTSGTYDMVTVAAHEMGHGLNFSGSADYSSGSGSFGYGSGYPTVYETFMENAAGKKLTSFTNPSTALGTLLTSNALYFNGTKANAANGGSRVKIYAPSIWSDGSSYSHLDYNTYAGTSNSMMVYALSSGSSNHNPGTVTLGMLSDMGWVTTLTPTPASPSGTIKNSLPTFTWSSIPDAAQYQISVLQGSTEIYSSTVDPSACSGATCSTTPTTVLSDGAYIWKVQAYLNDAWQAFSSTLAFTVNTVPTPSAPSGIIKTPLPAFVWSNIPNATQYTFTVLQGSDLMYSTTVDATVCSEVTCTTTPTTLLNDGAYSWEVQAYLNGVWRPLSSPTTFTVNSSPNPSAPKGTITTKTPTFTWSSVTGATQYNFTVLQGTTTVYSNTVDTGACISSSCSSTPATELSNGAYTWKVQAYINSNWQTFSSLVAFTVFLAPTPNSPAGLIDDNTPTFNWTVVPGATQYTFVVYKGTTTTSVYSKTVTSSACNTSTCSSTPSTALNDGSYTWKVRAYINAWSPYSPTLAFSVSTVPTAISPTGEITTSTPTFTWKRVTGATQYSFTVYNGSSALYSKTVVTSACGSNTTNCSSTPTTSLGAATYTWNVRAYVGGVWKSYSPVLTFIKSAAFDSEFTSNATGWTAFHGTWIVGSGYYQATESTGYYASSRYSTSPFGTMTYEVALKRQGDPQKANGILFNGTPSSSSSSNQGRWKSGYAFYITTNGTYSIWRYDSGIGTLLQTWKTSADINTSGINILKVTYNTDTGFVQFYINGVREAYGTLTAYSAGQVGLTYYDSGYSGGDRLYVDYAKVSLSAPSAFIAGPGLLISNNPVNNNANNLTKAVSDTGNN